MPPQVEAKCLPQARHAAWGGSSVGGHGDVSGGGSPWTVTGPLFGFACYLLVRPTLHYTVFGSRQPTTKAAS
jgi:hypothetical protein